MAKPKRLAAPSAAFQKTSLATVRVPKAHRWLRLHSAAHSPMYFGVTGNNRFDPPQEEFGVMYIARQIGGAFVEVFCRDGVRILDFEEIKRFKVAEICTSRSLRLVDLAGKGLVRLALDARLTFGGYKRAQSWSKAFYDHPDNADGILYPSRHDPKQHLAAVFDRAEELLSITQHGSIIDYKGSDFFALLDHYNIAVI